MLCHKSLSFSLCGVSCCRLPSIPFCLTRSLSANTDMSHAFFQWLIVSTFHARSVPLKMEPITFFPRGDFCSIIALLPIVSNLSLSPSSLFLFLNFLVLLLPSFSTSSCSQLLRNVPSCMSWYPRSKYPSSLGQAPLSSSSPFLAMSHNPFCVTNPKPCALLHSDPSALPFYSPSSSILGKYPSLFKSQDPI